MARGYFRFYMTRSYKSLTIVNVSCLSFNFHGDSWWRRIANHGWCGSFYFIFFFAPLCFDIYCCWIAKRKRTRTSFTLSYWAFFFCCCFFFLVVCIYDCLVFFSFWFHSWEKGVPLCADCVSWLRTGDVWRKITRNDEEMRGGIVQVGGRRKVNLISISWKVSCESLKKEEAHFFFSGQL